jgi:holo-[acyl-carrier protein] synthase
MNLEEAFVPGDSAASASGTIRAGVNRVELDDFRRTMDVAGQPFLDRLFTAEELAFSAGRVERLAGRFAAKEAVVKVLGTGFRGIASSEVEIATAPAGQPHVVLRGRAQRRAEEIHITSLAISITHTKTCAEAFAVGLCATGSPRRSPGEEIHHD